MKKTSLLLILLLAFALSSCSSKGPGFPPKETHRVGIDPLKALIIEQDTYNVPCWLEDGMKGRILVRLSDNDGLAPVGDDALAAIKKAADARDFKALLKMGNSNAEGTLFTRASTVYVANRLGLVDEVYWVVPTFGSITQEELDNYKDYLKKSLPGQEKDIDALALVDRVAVGKLSGVPIRILGIKDLPAMEKPVLLDIENSYFTAIYKDEKQTRIMGFVSGFFVELKDRKLVSDFVSLCPSNMDGAVPLKFRFLTLYLWTMLNKPGIIDGQPPDNWTERADAWKVEGRSPREALSIYRNILKNYPQDSASRYDLSEVYFRLGDMDNCRKALAEAARLDQMYGLAFADYASALNKAGKKAEAEKFIAAIKRR